MRFTTLLSSLLLLAPLALSSASAEILDSRAPEHGVPAVAAAHRRHHAKLARAPVPAPVPVPEAKADPAPAPELRKKKKGKRCNRTSTSSSASPTSTSTSTTSAPAWTPAADPAPSPTSSPTSWSDPAPWTSSSQAWSDPAPWTSSTTTSDPPAATPTDNSDAESGGDNALTQAGISAFLGDNDGGIGSWFRTDNSGDSTDGTSWCQLHYQDSWMGTAIPVDAMINSFGGDALAAMEAYCGLEIEAYNPANGNTVTVYVVDGFDQAWVLTPSSMDLTIAAFTALYGSFDDNKDTVVENMSWHFTGNRASQYSYNAQ